MNRKEKENEKWWNNYKELMTHLKDNGGQFLLVHSNACNQLCRWVDRNLYSFKAYPNKCSKTNAILTKDRNDWLLDIDFGIIAAKEFKERKPLGKAKMDMIIARLQKDDPEFLSDYVPDSSEVEPAMDVGRSDAKDDDNDDDDDGSITVGFKGDRGGSGASDAKEDDDHDDDDGSNTVGFKDDRDDNGRWTIGRKGRRQRR